MTLCNWVQSHFGKDVTQFLSQPNTYYKRANTFGQKPRWNKRSYLEMYTCQEILHANQLHIQIRGKVEIQIGST